MTPVKKQLNFVARFVISVAALFLLPVSASSQIQITLKNTFIEKHKDRATIDATFTVDKAHRRPNPPKKDGDLHIAGRAPEVGLPIVAELMNARDEDSALQAIKSAEQTREPLSMSGAWRIWCEHGGDSLQTQGARLEPFETTNPDHVFEIHPITKLNGTTVVQSFKPIAGFTPKDAEQAFRSYEDKKCEITVNTARRTTSIVTGMAGFNYVKFRIKLHSAPFPVADGLMVFATVLRLRDPEDEPGENEEDDAVLVRNRRMVFVKGTPPEAAVRNKGKGDIMVVLGIPRISLKLVSFRRLNRNRIPGILRWNLPYEMLIAAVFDDQ